MKSFVSTLAIAASAIIAATTSVASAASVTASVDQFARGAAGGLGTIDLTADGTLDWKTWSGSLTELDRKSGGSALGALTDLGTHNNNPYSADGFLYSWTDGTNTAASSDDDGVLSNNLPLNGGWTFDVAVAAAGDYQLTLYSASNGGTPYQLDATLSDSTTDLASGAAAASGVTDLRFTVLFTTDGADTLTIDLVRSATGAGDVLSVNAVTLSGTVAVPTPAALPAGFALIGLVAMRRRRTT